MTTPVPHQPGFAVNAHGPIAGRLFDLLYAHRDIRIVDVPDAGAFLAPETALALADLIARDTELRARIVDTAHEAGAA
jgi:hypothetical protein